MQDLENNVTISIFFDEDIPDETVQLIGEQIRVLDYVNTMDFISADEAFDKFCEQNYDDPKAAKAAFGDDNPLKNSASYEVTLKDVSKQAEFVAFAKGLDGVRNVRSSEVTADSISTLSSLVGYASVGIVVILMLVSIFLISNTITIGITVRKEEIAIMKLIGATDYFVRAPFIVEGVMIGLIGSVLPLILLYFVYSSVITYVSEKFVFLSSMLNFLPVGQVFRVLVPVALLLGVGIGFLGSRVTTKRHLNV